MKRLLYLAVIVCVLAGCSIKANPQWNADGKHGRYFEFGENSFCSVLVKDDVVMGAFNEDLAALVADLTATLIADRNIKTQPVASFTSDTIFNNEAYKDFTMSGKAFFFEIIIVQIPDKGTFISSGLMFNKGTKIPLYTSFGQNTFSLKHSYADPESNYIGIQSELKPAIENILDQLFNQVRKFNRVP